MAAFHDQKHRQPGKFKLILVPPVLNLFYKTHFYDNFPLGLFSLASGLINNGFDPEIYFPSKRLLCDEDYSSVASEILDSNPQVVGFSTWCITYPVSLLIARRIKTFNPATQIVFGGPQASLLGEETLQEFSFVDYILTGECDYTFPAFLKLLENGTGKSSLMSIPGLFFRSESGSIIRNNPAIPVQDLDALTVPSYDLAIHPDYLSLEVGRGCPFKCTYCTTSVFFSNTYRTKSADRIIREMDLAYDRYKISRFSFTHDMFTLNKKFITELCNKLIDKQHRQNRSYTWNCSARTDTVSEELLKMMKKAGCKEIFFGIETGSEKIQKSIGKGLDIQDAIQITAISAKLGFKVYTSFILGFPDEQEDDVEKTLKCIFQLATQGCIVQMSELAFLPGTPLYRQHSGELKFDGRYSDFADCLCSFAEIQLILKYPEIFSAFYYLPVKAFSRDELFYLQGLVNHLGDFVNTLFLLRGQLNSVVRKDALLVVFRQYFEEMKTHTERGAPLITFLIKKLQCFALSCCLPELNPLFADVFSFESARALMMGRFARWQLVRPGSDTQKKSLPLSIKPISMVSTPHWQLLTTSYRLESILPAENGWKIHNQKARIGICHYVVAAFSERECDYLKISDQKYALLMKLADDKSDENLHQLSGFKPGHVLNPFWKKMAERGVVEIY